MYADNTLTPKEAIRLCALGTLAAGPIRYADLATSIRHFISRITGPSLDLMAESIELLRYEGLVDQGRDAGRRHPHHHRARPRDPARTAGGQPAPGP